MMSCGVLFKRHWVEFSLVSQQMALCICGSAVSCVLVISQDQHFIIFITLLKNTFHIKIPYTSLKMSLKILLIHTDVCKNTY